MLHNTYNTNIYITQLLSYKKEAKTNSFVAYMLLFIVMWSETFFLTKKRKKTE